ncbi:MAG: hypothetical protein WD355_09450 [Balneolaceae bacterium]
MEHLYEWFMGLGESYGVDPLIFGLIYVGAIPFFWLALVWLAYNIRRQRSVSGPVLMACGCAVSSYVYLIVAGENVPYWVYGLIIVIIIYAVWSTLRKVKQKKEEFHHEEIV